MPVVALFPLEATVAAVFALILLFSLYLLAKILGDSVGGIPIVGGALAGIFHGLVGFALATSRHVLDGTLFAFSRAAWGFRVAFDAMIGGLADGVDNAANALYHLAFQAIPKIMLIVYGWAINSYRKAVVFAEQVYHSAINYATSLYHQALNYATSLYHSAINYATSLYHSAINYATSLFRTAEADLARDFAAAEARAAQLFRTSEADLARDFAAAEAQAQSLFRTAEADIARDLAVAKAYADAVGQAAIRTTLTDVDHIAHAAEQAIWPGVAEGVRGLEGVIGADFPAIGELVRAIPTVTPADLARALEIAGAIALPMFRYMEECGIPNCRNLGGFGNMLKDILGAAEAVAMLAWLIFMVRDPVAAAGDTAAVGDPLAAATLGALESLFGVRT